MSELDERWFYLLHPKVVHLVTTVDRKGRINAAPFSWLTPVSDDPPIILLAAWYETDTFKNVEETKELVVNVVPESLKKKMLICAKNYPRGVNELEKARLNWTSSKTVKPPRVVGCVAWLECVARECVRKEDEYSFVLADVRLVEVSPEYYSEYLPRKPILLHLGGEHYLGVNKG
jgi:flavin reductase (DIM6/NTAB) family NADH-FMN oxidoreductase RutF